MSLFLGKTIGRGTLKHAVEKPSFRKIGLGRHLLHKATRGGFTPGLSIETYALWQYLQQNAVKEVTVAEKGFSVDGKVVAGNEYVSEAFLAAGIKEINAEEIVGPEHLANMPREKTFLYMH